VRAVTERTARLQRLAQERQERVNTWRLAPVVEALQASRGVQVTVAVTTGAALGALTRFPNPQQLRSELGLTPSAYSRGPRRSQGGLTKPGHSHARRALLAGAGASRYRRRSVAICNCDGNNGPTPSRTSVGRRRSAYANGLDPSWLAARSLIKSRWLVRETGSPLCGL
jgi:hypothetical protein